MTIAIRSIVGYAIGIPPAVLPKGVTGQVALMNLVIAAAKSPRTSSDFTLGAPTVLTGNANYNSQVLVTATGTSNLQGSITLPYNRVDIGRIIDDKSHFDFSSATDLTSLLPLLNTASGMTLTSDDINPITIASTDESITLTAATTSRFFIPGLTIVLGMALKPITAVITGTTLDWS
jgi:hypothetical protein